MSGTAIIGELLLAHAPLVATVPAESMKEDLLPEGAELPALVAREVSSVERQMLDGSIALTIDRVAVTVRATSTKQRKAIMKLIRAACAGRTGTIAGCRSVAVLTAGAGPAVIGPGGSFEQTQDFRVSFDAPA